MRKTAAKMISSLATRFARSSQAQELPNLMRKSSNLSPSAALRHPPPQLHHRPPLLEPNSNPDPTGLLLASELPGSSPYSLFPAIFAAGVLGLGTIELSHADAEEGSSEPSQSSGRAESFASQERQRLEELLRRRGMQRGSYPPFTLAVKGQKVTVKFKIPPTCEVAHLIVDLVSHLGLMSEQHTSGSEMLLRAWNSAAAWQLTLNPSEKIREIGTEGLSKDLDKCEGEFCVLIFESLVGTEYCEIEFIKQGSLTVKELDALVSALKLAGERGDVKRLMGKRPKGFKGDSKYSSASLEKSVSALEAMGVRVYGFDEACEFPIDGIISWDNIAGYDQQKREIEDTILLALQSPEVYDDIAHGTRCKFEINRPRAVLFDGPPGTGKTSSARVIAKQAGVPLLYVPLEVIMSKYYGESERLLGNVFSLANDISNGAIIFLDEVDSIAVARDSEMHEVTRRILSVLLRQIDGFEQEKKVVVLAATNRKQDLDPALISRFDSIISFDLPDQQTREEIIAQYAKHLKKEELVQFASATEEMSGRDIKDVCQQAERRWASKLIRGQIVKDSEAMNLPPIEEYIRSAERRREASLDTSDRGARSSFRWKPSAVA